MNQEHVVTIYPYRWVVLIVFMLANAMIQVHWVVFAPITSEAAAFYGVTPLKIGLLSMVYMIAFIFLCIPASYTIDTYGLRIGVGIGVVLTGIFGLLKGLYPTNYTAIMISQCGLAAAQPFIMNAMTKVGANWFPVQERATAAGMAALSQYIGIIVAMAATPLLVKAYSLEGMLMIYGVLSIITTAVFLVFMREMPPTPPSEATMAARIAVFPGIRRIFTHRDMLLLLVLFFIGLGMFNAVTTWIEQILAPRGLNSEQAGLVGAAMMIGGIVGACILPPLSDRLRQRKSFLIVAMVGMAPGLVGITFCTSYYLLLASGFVLGFFIMSAGPIGFQYGAEVSYPAPESTSQGLILLAGQISGIIFIFGMDTFRAAGSGSMTPFMIVFIALTLVCVGVCLNLNESSLIKEAHDV